MPEEIPASPISILKQAIKAVPAVKYALGIGGIVAVIAIVFSFGINPKVAIFGTVIMLILMVVLLLFASLVRKSGAHVSLPALVFTWFSLLLFMATSVLLFTSAFWAKPLDLKTFISSSKAGSETSSPMYPEQNNPIQQNTSPDDQRTQHEQVTSSPLDQEARTWEGRGDEAAAFAILLEIKLHNSPAEDVSDDVVQAINTQIIAKFIQAQSAWTNALSAEVTKQYKAALRLKLKSGSARGLTCEIPENNDDPFCYSNGSEFDVLYSKDGRIPVTARHLYKKP